MNNKVATMSTILVTGGSGFKKARRMLGWAPRSNEESIVATAESLLRLGLLKDSRK
jgi:hypothetical protein